MNKDDLKRVIGRLEPDNDLEYRLSAQLEKNFQRRVSFKPVAAIAAGLVMIIGAGAFANYQINSNTKEKLGIKSQNGSVNNLIALLPDNTSPAKSSSNSQGGPADNSAALLPDNTAPAKSSLNSPTDHSDNSSALLPDNNAPAKSSLNSPTDHSDNSSALLPDNNAPAKSSLNSQDDRTASSGALSPDNTAPANSSLSSQDSRADNSSAPLPESTAVGKSGVIGQSSYADSSAEMPPANKANPEPGTMTPSNPVDNPKVQVTGGINGPNEGIYVPKLQLPVNTTTTATAKMLGLIVYRGSIYLQSALQIDSKSAEQLVGEKLGTTKGTLTEWSKQDDYAVELASTVGIQDVYTVKGYDKSFRIMTYEKINGEAYAYFFECLNDITVRTGKDIFGKFKMENNLESAKYENFDSWNNGKGNYKSLTNLDGFNNFLTALENSLPHDPEGLANLFDNQTATDQKFIYLKLNDGSEVTLRLFKDGYVYYNGVNLFFKVDSPAFNNFWNGLE
jgi:hypothetical protein